MRVNNSLHHVAVEVLSVKIVFMIILQRLDWSTSSVNCYHYIRNLTDLRKSLNFFHSILSCDLKFYEITQERIQLMQKFMATFYCCMIAGEREIRGILIL